MKTLKEIVSIILLGAGLFYFTASCGGGGGGGGAVPETNPDGIILSTDYTPPGFKCIVKNKGNTNIEPEYKLEILENGMPVIVNIIPQTPEYVIAPSETKEITVPFGLFNGTQINDSTIETKFDSDNQIYEGSAGENNNNYSETWLGEAAGTTAMSTKLNQYGITLGSKGILNITRNNNLYAAKITRSDGTEEELNLSSNLESKLQNRDVEITVDVFETNKPHVYALYFPGNLEQANAGNGFTAEEIKAIKEMGAELPNLYLVFPDNQTGIENQVTDYAELFGHTN